MIIKDGTNQWMRCTLCGETIELSRDDAANPETVLMHLQAMRVEHKKCDEYSLDPAKARIERIYYVGMRAALSEFAASAGTLCAANAPSH